MRSTIAHEQGTILNQSFLELELGVAGAAEVEDEPPLSDDDEAAGFDSLELALELLSLLEDDPESPLFDVSGLVFEPAAPPLP